MNFKFFKKSKTNNTKNEALVPLNTTPNDNLPEAYRGMQIYESDSDRFCTFDEECFDGENYEQPIKIKKKRKPIPPPKTPPSFFVGIFCGAISILLISGGIAFLSLFSKFGGIYTSVTVPNLTSLSENEAISLIKNHYNCFDYSIIYKENPNLASGAVISQIPKPSTARKLYGINARITIKLTVNKSAEPIIIPNLIGQNARDVELELKNAGINVLVSEEYSDKIKIGKIISSSHPAGASLFKNDTIHITKSLGKKISYVFVPDLLGLSESAAISKIKKVGLNVGKVIYKSSPFPLGTVLEQGINSEASVREGSKIDLVVSG